MTGFNLEELTKFGEETASSGSSDGYVARVVPSYGFIVYSTPRKYFPGQSKEAAIEHQRATNSGQPSPVYCFTVKQGSVLNNPSKWVEDHEIFAKTFQKDAVEKLVPSLKLLDGKKPDADGAFWIHFKFSVENWKKVSKDGLMEREGQNFTPYIVAVFDSEDEAREYAANLGMESNESFVVLPVVPGMEAEWDDIKADLQEVLVSAYDNSDNVDAFVAQANELGVPESYLRDVYDLFVPQES